MTKLFLICGVVAALVTGCGELPDPEVIESGDGASDTCPVPVVQANLCPDGLNAICIVSGADGNGGPPIGVIGCQVAHVPEVGTVAWAECVRACP